MNEQLAGESALDCALDMIVVKFDSRTGGERGHVDSDFENGLKRLSKRLRESGSLFLILEWDQAYRVKSQVERILGAGKHLRNEIIWVVRQARAVRGSVEKHFTILWYVSDPQLTPFERLTMPRSTETRKRFGDGKIISSVSLRTGRRAPARIEGESMAAPLNDVWVWDHDLASWVYELEEMDGRAVTKARVSANSEPVPESHVVRAAEEALESRLRQLSSCSSSGRTLNVTL